MVSSCSKRGIVSEGQSELILNGHVVREAAPTAKADEQLITLPETDLGVYVLATSGDAQTDFSTTPWKNLTFTADATGAISGTSDVILRMGTDYTIYAYAPRVAVDDPHRIPVQHGEDMLWAKTQVTATAKETKAQLKFYHSGAQIGFRLQMKNGEAVDLSGAQLTVSGFYRTGVLDVETGQMVLVAQDRTEVITDGSGAKTNILITGKQMDFEVTVTNIPGQDGKVFTGHLPVVLQSGDSYLYNVNIDTDNSRQSISFTPEVEEWTDVEAPGLLPLG